MKHSGPSLHKSITYSALALCLLAVGISPAWAQPGVPSPSPGDSAVVLILSSRVGPVIDADEAAQYHLFSQIATLQGAIAVELPDSSTAILFTTGGADKPTVDTLIRYSEITLKMIAEKIEHFEGMSNGTYKMGTQPADLQRAGYKLPLRMNTERRASVQASNIVTSNLPFRTADRPSVYIGTPLGKMYPREKSYPTFAVLFSGRNFNPDTKGLAQTVGADVDYGIFLEVGAEVRISPVFGIQVEGGGSTGNEGRLASGGLAVYPQIFSNADFMPFFGAGFAAISVGGAGNGLEMEAGSNGYYLTGGIEYVLGSTASVNLFATYSHFGRQTTSFTDWASGYRQNPDGSYTTVTPDSIPASMNLSNVAVGIRLKLQL